MDGSPQRETEDALRRCTRCGVVKVAAEFYKKDATTLRSECKDCFKQLMRPRSKRHYEANKAYYRRRNQRQRVVVAEYVLERKIDKTCADCGLPHPPWRLDFDHLDGATKVINISSIAERGWSLSRVQREIDKCELVCANCHRDRTRARLIERAAAEMKVVGEKAASVDQEKSRKPRRRRGRRTVRKV